MLVYKGYRIALGALPYVPETDRAWMPVADIWADDGPPGLVGQNGKAGPDGIDAGHGDDRAVGGDVNHGTAPMHFAWSVLACATVEEAKATAEVLARSAIDKGLTNAGPHARRSMPAPAEEGDAWASTQTPSPAD